MLNTFLESQNLYCHIKQKTCWKAQHGSCIDLILSNRKHSFQNTGVVDTGISDHHSLIYAMLKAKHVKCKSKEIRYRDYSKFNEEDFVTQLYNV